MITVSRLCVRYGQRLVLNDLSLTVPQGRITVLLGRNGGGKTTLLKTIGGLLTPAAGEVRLNGEPLSDIPRRRLARQVAFMPQQRPVPSLTVRQLLSCARYPYCGVSRRFTAADRTAIDRAVTQCDIAAFLNRPLATLSGGERQRVYVAMLLAQECGTLLLDEPTAFLDAATAFAVGALLSHARDNGHPVLAAVHDLPLALTLADRVAVMDEGRVVFEGTPHEAVASGVLSRVFHVNVTKNEQGYTVSPL